MNNDIRTMTSGDFAQLLASVDDSADRHILWVSKSGLVFLSPRGRLTPTEWEAQHKAQIQFHWEAFQCGNGHCGKKAAEDASHVAELLKRLKKDWAQGKTGLVDDSA